MTNPAPMFCALPGAHYLHPQKTSRVPRRYVFFDTEAHRETVPGGERQTWRLGVTGTVNWLEGTKRWSKPALARHEAPGDLWEAVTGFARTGQRTVVVAHNLAYDLRISRGLELLPAMGWTISRPTFHGDHVGFEARKGPLTLVLVDSLTVLPHGLDTIAGWLGMTKPDLPDEAAGEATWWQRCEADVAILARAYMTIMDWLSSEDIGGWARTGPGIGWHVMLRRHLTHNVLVHGRAEVRDAEGAAMYAGRAEVWKHGHLRGGPWHEWDYALAYAHVCAENVLPAVLVDEVRGAGLRSMQRSRPGFTWLVEAEVSTTVPVLPWADHVGICWPTGQFSGWWWDHELDIAEAAGAGIAIRRAWRYRAAPWLSSWAAWCIEQVHDESSPEARVKGAAAKHWTRAVPGRSAMRYKAWEDRGAAWAPGVAYMPLLDMDNGKRGAALILGNQRWESWASSWWDNALPQLLGSVMAHSRVKLWHAMQTAGFDNIAYVDTDSLIVNSAGSERLSEAVADGYLWSLRYKGAHQALEITAPQLIEGSTYRRLAGVPRGARRTGPLDYSAELWEGLTTSVAEGHPGEVHIKRAKLAMTGIDTRRLHLPGGGTVPFTVTDGARQDRKEEAS